MAQAKKRTRRRPGRSLFGLGALVIGSIGLIAAGVTGALFARRKRAGAAEHVPIDLMAEAPPAASNRAPEHFRPDPTAPVPPDMRESLRPASSPGPTLNGGESNVTTPDRG